MQSRVKMRARDWTLWYGGEDEFGKFWYLVFPHETDETKVRKTSPVIGNDNDLVYTESGSVYQLVGPPSQNYLDLLRRCQLVYSENRPIPEHFWWSACH